MSTPDIPDQPPPLTTEAAREQPTETVPSPKSYRRKYRKIMVKFERKMRENTTLFREEQKLLDMSQRLAEQTDQLLQLLVDLNSCPQIPKRLRFDLTPKYLAKDAPSTDDQTYTEESAHMALRKARDQLQTGEITPHAYADLQEHIMQSTAFSPGNSYSNLTELASTLPPPRSEPADGASPELSGFLTVKQEEQYLQNIDGYLNGERSEPRARAANALGAKNAEKSTERERDMQLRNPVSVYNWLRKNRPAVFLQDHDSTTGDKTSRPTGSRISKRNANRESLVKQEEGKYDDDGIALDSIPSKGKRKRDDDGGYRPKGGISRPTKRRKEEPSGRRSKKSSVDIH